MKLNPQAFARRFGEEMRLINHWTIWLELLFGLMVTIWTLLSQKVLQKTIEMASGFKIYRHCGHA